MSGKKKTNREAVQLIRADILRRNVLTKDHMTDLIGICDRMLQDPKDREYALQWTKWVKDMAQKMHIETQDEDYGQIYMLQLLSEARNFVFDSYMLYLEHKRDPKDKFYQPRRKCLMKTGVIQALQDMIDDKLDILSISLPPSTGKTTLEKFFVTAIMGWFPRGFSLFYSHSGDITRMFFDGVYNILIDDLEYAWNEIFPTVKITGTNAKTEQINVGKYKPFASLQTTSVGAKNSGKVRCSKFLLCDDLIGGIEEALNKALLDKLWNIYAVDARQRKTVDENQRPCKEIHIATRWSVHDVIGRLQTLYEDNPRARFIAIPDIDPETGESNFLYDYGGFDTDFFHEQEKVMDDISYRCLYKNDPVEREGLLYHEDELRRYTTLPQKEPDAILGVCDTKTTGSDFMVLPVVYQFGEDYYVEDVVYNDSTDYIYQQNSLANCIVRNNMQQCEFESNAGGGRLALEVEKLVRERKGGCTITTKPTETNKETRIIVNSDWVKRNCLFKQKDCYEPKSEYGQFMKALMGYSVRGKNKHDDAPDAMANLAIKCTRIQKIARCDAVVNPFRMGGTFL